MVTHHRYNNHITLNREILEASTLCSMMNIIKGIEYFD